MVRNLLSVVPIKYPISKNQANNINFCLLIIVTHADMPQLLKALEEIYYQWQLFAVQLGVATKDIHAIEVQGRRKDLSMCLQDALGSWFAMTETKHTWWHVCEAVEMCDNNRLADHLRTKYKKKLNGEGHYYTFWLLLPN